MTGAELNRLRWRCRRGMLELDVILLRYLETDFIAATPAARAAFTKLLEMDDADLLTHLAGGYLRETMAKL